MARSASGSSDSTDHATARAIDISPPERGHLFWTHPNRQERRSQQTERPQHQSPYYSVGHLRRCSAQPPQATPFSRSPGGLRGSIAPGIEVDADALAEPAVALPVQCEQRSGQLGIEGRRVVMSPGARCITPKEMMVMPSRTGIIQNSRLTR